MSMVGVGDTCAGAGLGLGCYEFGRRVDEACAVRMVDAAFDADVAFFDTSDSYGEPRGASEEVLGAALRGRRHRALVATKFGSAVSGGANSDGRGSRQHIRRAVEASLRRLGTDWIDLYQMHLPDPSTPLTETLAALDELVRAGKVRRVGCANFSARQLAEAGQTAYTRAYAPFVSVQHGYSLLDRAVEEDIVPACQEWGTALVAYTPLANGLLTGKYVRGAAPPEGSRLADVAWRDRPVARRVPWLLLEELAEMARNGGRSLPELALGWVMTRPAVTAVLVGATSAEQIRANAAASRCRLGAEEEAALERVLRTHPGLAAG